MRMRHESSFSRCAAIRRRAVVSGALTALAMLGSATVASGQQPPGIGLDSGLPSVAPGVATYRDGLRQPPILITDTFYEIDSSLTYEREAWRIQAYGLNLANNVYVAGQSNAGSNPDNEILGHPRQYGVRVSRSF